LILRGLSELHGIDWKKLIKEYPKFEHLDRLVTVFVFVDLLPKMTSILTHFLIAPLWTILQTAAAVVAAIFAVTVKIIGGTRL
jgi:hypothetical protein